ncbi:GIN domain-containing protein [Paraburkholderia sp. BCC1885]|uniref:GIN domain-containing protein n=1 Tax=Paraburkholderia sp. BCC1885 TaxID=2562669 RepID=UPI00118291E2|nr:DUF2807 domain-containing protein [Paraburkholderia sp. BCC1885]
MKVPTLPMAAALALNIFASAAMAQANSGAMMRVSTDSSIVSVSDQTETRPAGKFSGIDLRAPADVVFSVGASPSIIVSGPAEVLPLLLTSIHDDVLTISLKDSVTQMKGVKVVITNPSLHAVNVTGSGSMKASGINGASLDLNVSGSGAIVAAGRATTVNVAVSGSGEADVHAIHASTVNASVHGSGDLRAYASSAAIVDVAGSGDVKISGKPATRVVHRGGSGDVSFE